MPLTGYQTVSSVHNTHDAQWLLIDNDPGAALQAGYMR